MEDTGDEGEEKTETRQTLWLWLTTMVRAGGKGQSSLPRIHGVGSLWSQSTDACHAMQLDNAQDGRTRSASGAYVP